MCYTTTDPDKFSLTVIIKFYDYCLCAGYLIMMIMYIVLILKRCGVFEAYGERC
jgi:hypothetical protein